MPPILILLVGTYMLFMPEMFVSDLEHNPRAILEGLFRQYMISLTLVSCAVVWIVFGLKLYRTKGGVLLSRYQAIKWKREMARIQQVAGGDATR